MGPALRKRHKEAWEVNLEIDTSDAPEPKDVWNLGYGIFLLQGIGQLFPWNAFISATTYFSRRFCGTPFANNYENFFSVVYNISCAVGLTLAVRYQSLLRPRVRVLLPLGVASTAFLACGLLALAPAVGGTAAFAITMLCLVATALSIALMQSALFGIAARFPSRFTQAMLAGQGVAGLLVALAGLFTTLAAPDATICEPTSAAALGTSSIGNALGSSEDAVDQLRQLQLSQTPLRWVSLFAWAGAASAARPPNGSLAAAACAEPVVDGSALSYFGIACGTLVLCAVGYVVLERLPVALFYLSQAGAPEELLTPATAAAAAAKWDALADRGGPGSREPLVEDGGSRRAEASILWKDSQSLASSDAASESISESPSTGRAKAKAGAAAESQHPPPGRKWSSQAAAAGAAQKQGYSSVPPSTPLSEAERGLRERSSSAGAASEPAGGSNGHRASEQMQKLVDSHNELSSLNSEPLPGRHGALGQGDLEIDDVVTPSLWKVLRTAWSPATAVFLVFAVTLAVFPATTARIVSRSRCQSGASRVSTDLFVPLSFVSFNLFDLLGRVLSGWRRLIPARHLWAAALARIAFVPLFLACAVEPASSVPTLFRADGFPVAFMMAFALSNGYISSLGMMAGPETLPSGPARERAGTGMVVCLNAGLLTGSILSFAILYGLG